MRHDSEDLERVDAPRQLVLALDHAISYAREDFLEGPSNAKALALVERWPDWPSRLIALIGPEGSGKSHLAAIWAELSGARVISARRLGETDLPQSLATGALVVEDLDTRDGDGHALDERALFHLINLAREEGADILFTSRVSPPSLPVHIRDLQSRLRMLPVVELEAPDDEMLRALLFKLAADRQLAVDAALVNFLANRIERSFAGAHRAVAELDEEALRRQRPVTRALAAELFRAT
ncbi:chromosomal replication initiator DnaA [Undibacter mobilis]|uniref:Chromosomal replication initiator DnaA n=2 Tax=Undibacter mobilis TaxID=2292256 RepID=A0A371B454_9BRAD|nr:chromosomal replication initiator DnaA [Undibacter mobilis]